MTTIKTNQAEATYQDDKTFWETLINDELKARGSKITIANMGVVKFAQLISEAQIVGPTLAVNEFLMNISNQDDPRNDDMARLTIHTS